MKQIRVFPLFSILCLLAWTTNPGSTEEQVCEDKATECSKYTTFCNDTILGDIITAKCRLSCGLCTACNADGKCPLSQICNQETKTCEPDPDFVNVYLPVAVTEAPKGCAVGWKYLQNTDSCYYFQHTIARYDQAVADCESRDATITSITSIEERDFINNQFKSKFESYWIGLKKKSGRWTWPDGSEPADEILHWRITQPDLCCGFDVTCTLVNYIGTDGYWDDADCGFIWNLLGQGYACKKNATEVKAE